MTTKIEQEFFEVFGIEKECVRGCGEYYFFENGNIDAWNLYDCKNSDCSKCEHDKSIWRYPKITNRKLLKLICINSYFCGVNFHNLWVKNPDELKAIILDEIIRWYKEQKYGYEKCKQQIQQLFKEEE